MNRREVIVLVGGAAVGWPGAAHAQQATIPVIGFLSAQSPDTNPDRLRAFRQGLKENGYVEGENVAIEYRWAENQLDRLPAMAAELVRRQLAVIVATIGSAPSFAAKAVTTTIPIVFAVGEDPVRLGLVDSLARPRGNLTGVNALSGELTSKRLELLRALVPDATRLAVLVNPANTRVTESILKDVETAAHALGMKINVLNASTSREINVAFATFLRERPDALFVANDGFFTSRRVQIANLASRHVVPMTSGTREIAEVGGLISYGSNITHVMREVGVYTGRILKGAKPTDLPVVQSSKFELVVNAETARMLGLTVPPSLLAIADEVIE